MAPLDAVRTYPEAMDETSQAGRVGRVAATQFAAEFLGTALLVFAGVGSAIFAINTGGVIVVGLTFGLVVLTLTYALGPVSGAHLNPAVTLGALLSRTVSPAQAIVYWTAQVTGAVLAAFALFGLVRWGGVTDETGVLGANEYGRAINAGGAMVLEFLLTFLFVLVVLLVTGRAAQASIRGAAIGLALGLCNLVAIPLDGASINPARSIGPALFQGGVPLGQLWLFIVFPSLGGVAAALVALVFRRAPVRAEAAGGPGRAVDWRAMNLRPGPGATSDADVRGVGAAVDQRAGTRPKRSARR